jgi:hypothetical protein
MRRLAALALAAALMAAACGSDNTPTTPTTPNTPNTTDTFTGTLTPSGGNTFPFITARSGSITATLTSLGPDSGLTVGLLLGTWNGNACSVQSAVIKDNAVQGSTILGAASAAGSLCVRIYDVGNLTGPVDFQITVIHP